jgi:cell division protein FtsQ
MSAPPSSKPQNRRVRRQSLPPDVLAEELERSSPKARLASDEDIAAEPPKPKKPLSPRMQQTLAVARAVFGLVIVVATACGVAWGARRYVTMSPRFAVQDVVVLGAHRYAPEDIEAKAGLARGQNVFSLDLDAAHAKLLTDPWIAHASLVRRLPGAVVIDIEERQAAAIVASIAGDMWLAGPTGELFKRLEPTDPHDLVVVTGIDEDAVLHDSEGVAKTVRRGLDLASDYDRCSLASRLPLQEVHVATTGLVLVVGKHGLELALGAPPYRKKLDQAARVVAELDHRGAKADALLLDNDAREGRVVARLKGPKAPAQDGVSPTPAP